MGLWEAGMGVTDDRLNASTGAAEDGKKVFIASGTMASANYLDIPGNAGAATSVPLVKYTGASKLFVAMKTNLFSDAASTAVRLGIRINGVDYDVALGYYTLASQYHPVIGWAFLSGIPAGSYTCQARWKRTAGGGNITANSGISELDIDVCEVGL